MKPWVKTKRIKAGFTDYGFASCAICSAGVVLHRDVFPPVISCGDSHGARKDCLLTAQDLPDLCPREIKKQKIASRAQRGARRKVMRLSTG